MIILYFSSPAPFRIPKPPAPNPITGRGESIPFTADGLHQNLVQAIAEFPAMRGGVTPIANNITNKEDKDTGQVRQIFHYFNNGFPEFELHPKSYHVFTGLYKDSLNCEGLASWLVQTCPNEFQIIDRNKIPKEATVHYPAETCYLAENPPESASPSVSATAKLPDDIDRRLKIVEHQIGELQKNMLNFFQEANKVIEAEVKEDAPPPPPVEAKPKLPTDTKAENGEDKEDAPPPPPPQAAKQAQPDKTEFPEL